MFIALTWTTVQSSNFIYSLIVFIWMLDSTPLFTAVCGNREAIFIKSEWCFKCWSEYHDTLFKLIQRTGISTLTGDVHMIRVMWLATLCWYLGMSSNPCLLFSVVCRYYLLQPGRIKCHGMYCSPFRKARVSDTCTSTTTRTKTCMITSARGASRSLVYYFPYLFLYILHVYLLLNRAPLISTLYKPKNYLPIDFRCSLRLNLGFSTNFIFSNEGNSINYNSILCCCYKIWHPNLVCFHNNHTANHLQTSLKVWHLTQPSSLYITNLHHCHMIRIPDSILRSCCH